MDFSDTAGQSIIKLEFSPLTFVALHTLIVLAAGENHAYLIAHRIPSDALGSVIISKSSVRVTLARLVAAGLIERAGLEQSEFSGKKRQLYRLTEAGWGKLRQEQRRLRETVRVLDGRWAAQAHNLI